MLKTKTPVENLRHQDPTQYRVMKVGVACFFICVSIFAIGFLGGINGDPWRYIFVAAFLISLLIGIACFLFNFAVFILDFFKRKPKGRNEK